jgi:MFS family permease
MLVIVGVPGAAIGAGIATLEQIRAEDRQRGRVIGAIGALGAIGSLVGAVLAGFAGEVVPVVALLVVQGSGYLIGGLVVAFMTRSVTTVSPVATAETEVTAT